MGFDLGTSIIRITLQDTFVVLYLSILADDDNDYIDGNVDLKVKGSGGRSGLVYVTWTVRTTFKYQRSSNRGIVNKLRVGQLSLTFLCYSKKKAIIIIVILQEMFYTPEHNRIEYFGSTQVDAIYVTKPCVLHCRFESSSHAISMSAYLREQRRELYSRSGELQGR